MSEPTVLIARRPTVSLRSWIFLAVVAAAWLAWLPTARSPALSERALALTAILGACAVPLVLGGTINRMRRDRGMRLEIGPERVAVILVHGGGREWRKADGALVRVVGRGRRRSIRIGEHPVGVPAPHVRLFDVEEIRAACVSHGWTWREEQG